jgi:hypothetical protein
VAKGIAEMFLEERARTANEKTYDAHMDLVSRRVQVFGVPGFEVLGYDDWARQCEHEFKEGILKRVSYSGLKVVVNRPTRVMFKTLETVEASDGATDVRGIEVVIDREPDGRWRVTQERVLPDEEAVHDGLKPRKL